MARLGSVLGLVEAGGCRVGFIGQVRFGVHVRYAQGSGWVCYVHSASFIARLRSPWHSANISPPIDWATSGG